MKQSILALVVTALLAIGAGIAIAGLPSELEGGDVVVTGTVPTTSTSTVPPPPISVASLAPPAVESPPPDTVDPAPAPAPAPDTTELPVPITSGDDSSGDDSSGDDSSGDASNGQAATTTTVFEPESLAPEELVVAAANATSGRGVAAATAERLGPLGYADISTVDADPSAASAVYYQPGLEEEASRLAVDLGWVSTSIAPVDEMPALRTERSFDLVALVGADQV